MLQIEMSKIMTNVVPVGANGRSPLQSIKQIVKMFSKKVNFFENFLGNFAYYMLYFNG